MRGAISLKKQCLINYLSTAAQMYNKDPDYVPSEDVMRCLSDDEFSD